MDEWEKMLTISIVFLVSFSIGTCEYNTHSEHKQKHERLMECLKKTNNLTICDESIQVVRCLKE